MRKVSKAIFVLVVHQWRRGIMKTHDPRNLFTSTQILFLSNLGLLLSFLKRLAWFLSLWRFHLGGELSIILQQRHPRRGIFFDWLASSSTPARSEGAFCRLGYPGLSRWEGYALVAVVLLLLFYDTRAQRAAVVFSSQACWLAACLHIRSNIFGYENIYSTMCACQSCTLPYCSNLLLVLHMHLTHHQPS